ncbi:hypothetical protein V5F44_07605 [Xanthobacter sp. V2C-8]|uniref:hypothetical protein n=1 Tax=Xanthobacter albus TaxID=3119929 RepID=UPI003727AAB0
MYLAKPFNPREPFAQIHTVLRRRRPSDFVAISGGTSLKLSGRTLDTRRRELANPEGAVVDLSTGEYDLLLTFLERPRRVRPRDQLMDDCQEPRRHRLRPDHRHPGEPAAQDARLP